MISRRIKDTEVLARDLPINAADADTGTKEFPVRLFLSHFNSKADGEGDPEHFASFMLTKKSAEDLANAIRDLVEGDVKQSVPAGPKAPRVFTDTRETIT